MAGPQAALPPRHQALCASCPAGVALGISNQGAPLCRLPASASWAEPGALLPFGYTTKARQTEPGRERGWVRWCWREPSPFPPSAPSSLPAPRGGRRANPTHECPSLRASGRLSQPWHGDVLLPGDLSHWAQGDVLVSAVGWPRDRRDRGGPAQRQAGNTPTLGRT